MMENRVESLLARITLAEKIAQTDIILGVEAVGREHPAHSCTIADDAEITEEMLQKMFGEDGVGFICNAYAVPRIANAIQRYAVERTRQGIPVIFVGEALHGLCRPDTTIFPVPLGLAATFDRQLVEAVGRAIAAETRAFSVTEILAPNLDLGREVRWGRLEETFGEDTYLAAELGVAIIRGEQGDDVSAPGKVVTEPKHFCVHGVAEGGLNCGTARVGRREIETEHLPVFAAAIQRAGAYNVMASYNTIDGEAVVASRRYLTDILRQRWGLRGYVRSDFGAVNRLHSLHRVAATPKDAIRMALQAGLCTQGFDYPSAVWRATVRELVEEGAVSLATLDEAVRRILRVKFALGLFDNPYVPEDAVAKTVRTPAHLDLARRAARAGVCLLKNDGLLPLQGYRRVAVVGPGSNTQYVGGYSPVPHSYRPPSVYESLCRLAPAVTFEQADGCCFSEQADGCCFSEQAAAAMPAAWFEGGVKARFYRTADFSGPVVAERTYRDFQIKKVTASVEPPLPVSHYSVVFEATCRVDVRGFAEGEEFTGTLVLNTIDTFRLFVDGRQVMDNIAGKTGRCYSMPFTYRQGARHTLRLELLCDSEGWDLSLGVGNAEQQLAAAVAVAQRCEAIILVCGENGLTSGESRDRCTIELDPLQRRLVEAMTALGKPMALLLQTGHPVDLRRELPVMNAILVNFFGGDFGGEALAEAVLGRFSPAGRLPVSFPRSIGHVPSYYCRLRGRAATGYVEMDGANLFDFGFGLSYTTFEYRNLRIENRSRSGELRVDVAVDVANVGRYDSDEVVQVYVSDVCSSVATPPKRLQGFERIHLRQGETRTVRFTLGFDAFKLLNTDYEWVVEPGEFEIMVGAGSREIKLTGTVRFEEEYR